MKRITQVLASLFIGCIATLAHAKVENYTNDNGKKTRLTNRYHYTQPIMFMERGIEFMIFPNGEFDFNTEILSSDFNSNVYYRNSNRRSTRNTTYGAPRQYYNYTNPKGTLVLHDRYGRIRRIGNVFLSYDSRGRIKRAGTVYMRYRNGLLRQVGGLTLQYNTYDQVIGSQGQVNFTRPDFDCFDFNDDKWVEDPVQSPHNDMYYYKNNTGIEREKRKI
ncbi:MAG: hypothetical protein HRT67_02140 [Flavobacteriaceae bacterium]|nr:hypothetical protein [Flavobacteriaceae bacterium]